MPIVPIRRPDPAPHDPHPEIVVRSRTRRKPPPQEGVSSEKVTGQSPKPDYDVGYAKPPRHTRFKAGQSGNPRGRPRGAKGLKTIVRETLTEKVTVRTSRGPKRMTRIQALFAKITELAFAGNMRALQLLMQHYQQSVIEPAGSTPSTMEAADPDAHDLAILDEMRAILRAEEGGQP